MQIKNYVTYQDEQKVLYQQVLVMSATIETIYPDYIDWYQRVFLTGLKRGERALIVATNRKHLVGCALVKKTPDESKICTLFVHPDHRGKGIGTQLMKASLSYLGPHPLLTVSEQNLAQFQPLLNKFNFHLDGQAKRGKHMEYYFNDRKRRLIKTGLIPVLLQRIKQLTQR